VSFRVNKYLFLDEKPVIANWALVHLINQQAPLSYLDVCGNGQCRDGYGVETTPDLSRDATYKTSTWGIRSVNNLQVGRYHILIYNNYLKTDSD
jgi:hypothetical protein